MDKAKKYYLINFLISNLHESVTSLKYENAPEEHIKSLSHEYQQVFSTLPEIDKDYESYLSTANKDYCLPYLKLVFSGVCIHEII